MAVRLIEAGTICGVARRADGLSRMKTPELQFRRCLQVKTSWTASAGPNGQLCQRFFGFSSQMPPLLDGMQIRQKKSAFRRLSTDFRHFFAREITFLRRSMTDSDFASATKWNAGRFCAVAFDAVGTVMYPGSGVAAAYRAAIHRHCGVEISDAVVTAAVRDGLLQRSASDDLQTNEAAEHEFWAALIRQLCPNSSGFQACFDDLFAHFGDPANWNCFPDVADAISTIQAAGYTCAIASNFDRRLNSVCDGLPELSTVSNRIISSVVGWRKTCAAIFRRRRCSSADSTVGNFDGWRRPEQRRPWRGRGRNAGGADLS